MGRYKPTYREPAQFNEKPEVHPIWRGVGFALIILIPLLSYGLAILLLNENAKFGWFPIPQDLLSKWVEPLLFVKILLTLALSFLIYVLFQLITYIIFRLFGPSRYGLMDLPPVQRKIRKRTRR
jgi:hypothetical protein